MGWINEIKKIKKISWHCHFKEHNNFWSNIHILHFYLPHSWTFKNTFQQIFNTNNFLIPLYFVYLADYVIPDVDLLVDDELVVLQQAEPLGVALLHLQPIWTYKPSRDSLLLVKKYIKFRLLYLLENIRLKKVSSWNSPFISVVKSERIKRLSRWVSTVYILYSI